MTSSKCHAHMMLQTRGVSAGKRHLILGDGLMTDHNVTPRHISETVNDKTAVWVHPLYIEQ